MTKLMIIRIFRLILTVLISLAFYGSARAQETQQSANDYAEFMEYWLIFIQTIGGINEKERIETAYPKAIQEMEKFIEKNPTSRWATEAKMRIAEFHQLSSFVMFPTDPAEVKLNKNWRNGANRWLLDIVKNHPNYLYFNAVAGAETGKPMAALALFRLGIWNNDPVYLERLLQEYPESEEAKSLAPNFQSVTQTLKDRKFYERLVAAIEAGRKELPKIKLNHSSKRVRLSETRRYGARGNEAKYGYDDFASKEIALKVFNLETLGSLNIKARKVRQKVSSLQPEFVVGIEPKPSGIIWNGRNTAYQARGVNGSQWAVILNNFPTRLKNGKRKDTLYAPYSTILHRPIIVEHGSKYLWEQITLSLFDLGRLSSAASTRLDIITKAHRMAGEAIMRLALIEHTDFFEFKEFQAGRWPYNPFERVLVILSLNREDAFSMTFSDKVRAAGLMQATNRGKRRRPGTWDTIRKTYPWAKLPPFPEGALNHREAIKFAILLQDFNLGGFVKEFGEEIYKDPELEYYLAAAYNGGRGHVIRAIKESRKKGTGWRHELAKIKKTSENLDFLEKLDHLKTPEARNDRKTWNF